MDEEEIEEETFDDIKPHEKTPKIDIPEESDIPIPNSEVHRSLQRGEILNNNETYDTELSVQEPNISVVKETFRGEEVMEAPPLFKSPKEIIEGAASNPPNEIPKRRPAEPPQEDVFSEPEPPPPPKPEKPNAPVHFEQDKDNPIPIKAGPSPPVKKDVQVEKAGEDGADDIPEEPPPRKENPLKRMLPPKKPTPDNEVIVPADLDEDEDSKEYISRRSIIISEKEKERENGRAIQKYTKKVTYVEEEIEEEKEVNWGRIFLIVLILAVLLGGVFWGIRSGFFENQLNTFSLSDLDRAILTKEYDFISGARQYLETINSAVDEERQIIESYVNSGISSDDAVTRLNGVLATKKEAYESYSTVQPNYEEVAETKRLADDIFIKTIAHTENAIESISGGESKARLIANFNAHVDSNNSNIYLYNNYVISVFQKRNIQITYNNTSFSMDTTWLKSSK